jgi:hypothetical protein
MIEATMSATAERLSPIPRGLLSEAKVIDVRPEGPLLVELDGGGRSTAKLALLGAYEPKAGDVVLCLGGDEGAVYIVGVLRSLRPATAPVVAADGSTAGADADGQIWVKDASGRLVFEHGPGASVVHAPTGDLEFIAGGALRFQAKGEVAFEGDQVTLTGRALESTFERIMTRAETMESRVGRLVERARETYREVEDLAQTRAGRLRLVAKKTLHALGQRTLVKADEDMKIKGEKIYLG